MALGESFVAGRKKNTNGPGNNSFFYRWWLAYLIYFMLLHLFDVLDLFRLLNLFHLLNLLNLLDLFNLLNVAC